MISMLVYWTLWSSLCRVSVLDSVDDDPSLWPGHLEPFGSKQKVVDVDVLEEYPLPQSKLFTLALSIAVLMDASSILADCLTCLFVYAQPEPLSHSSLYVLCSCAHTSCLTLCTMFALTSSLS